jgi:phage baseplate assembly protein W
MPFIDVPDFDGTHTIDRTAIDKIPFNLKIEQPNWAKDVSLNTKQQGVISDLDVISQSIFNVLLTMKGERLFNLQFGANIFAHIFENTDSANTVRHDIYNSLTKYEPRIDLKLNDIKIAIDPERHSVSIELIYYIKLTREVGLWSETLYI